MNLRFANSDLRSAFSGGSSRRVGEAVVIRKSPFVNSAAFTLIEMLVVLVIIGIMAGLVVPKLGTLAKAHSMTVGSQQIMDDVAYARQKALNDHTTIFMVFIPPEYWKDTRLFAGISAGSKPESWRQVTNLIPYQAVGYALFSKRDIGDQPGRPRARYLTGWRQLPDGVVIETNKFETNQTLVDYPLVDLNDTSVPPRTFNVTNFARWDFPFPPAELTNAVGSPVEIKLPYIAFDSQGRLVEYDKQGQLVLKTEAFIPLAPGSIILPQDANEVPQMQTPDILEKNYREPGRTNYTLLHIDGLTGRAKLERPELK